MYEPSDYLPTLPPLPPTLGPPAAPAPPPPSPSPPTANLSITSLACSPNPESLIARSCVLSSNKRGTIASPWGCVRLARKACAQREAQRHQVQGEVVGEEVGDRGPVKGKRGRRSLPWPVKREVSNPARNAEGQRLTGAEVEEFGGDDGGDAMMASERLAWGGHARERSS